MPVDKRIQAVKKRSGRIVEGWVRQITREARFVRLKDVPDWRLRAFGLAVLRRFSRRMQNTNRASSLSFRPLGHLQFKQWVPVPEFVACLQMLRREILAAVDVEAVRRGRLMDADAAEFRARTDRFFDDFVQWLVWESDFIASARPVSVSAGEEP